MSILMLYNEEQSITGNLFDMFSHYAYKKNYLAYGLLDLTAETYKWYNFQGQGLFFHY